MAKQDYYDTLGISKSASESEIKNFMILDQKCRKK